MTTTAPADPDADEVDSDLPIVGDDTDDDVKRTSFRLPWLDSRDRKHLETLTARAELDSGSVFALNKSNLPAEEQLDAIQKLILRVLVDTDGVSREAEPELISGKDDDTDSGAELAVIGAEPDDDVELAGQWRIDDVDETFPSRSLAEQYAREHGSSLRRFIALMDNPFAIVRLGALTGIINHIVSASADDRPTKPSRASSRSRRTKGRSGR